MAFSISSSENSSNKKKTSLAFSSRPLEYSLGALLLHQIRQYPWYYLGGSLCLFITHRLQTTIPVLAKDLAQGGLAKGLPVATCLGLFLGILIVRTLSRQLFFYPARLQQRDLTLELMKFLETIHPAHLRHYSSGQLFQIIKTDFNQLRAMMGFAFLQVVNVSFGLIVILPRLFSFHEKLFFALWPTFAGVIIFSTVIIRCLPFHRKAQSLQGDLQDLVIESYQAKKTIQTHHKEHNVVKSFETLSQGELRQFYLAELGDAWAVPLTQLGLGLSLVWGAWIILQQDLGASALVYYSGMLYLLREPLLFLSWIGVVIIQGKASWDRIRELTQNLSSESHKVSSETFLLSRYHDPLKTKIWEKGKWYALVGKVASGKSYFLQSMKMRESFSSGSVSYLPQTPYLFNDTLEKNIFLGHRPTLADYDFMRPFLELFELHLLLGHEEKPEDIWKLEVGENGKRLSGGQIKRVGLLRSLFEKADFYLWDDPFSAMDVLLEKNILTGLKQDPFFRHKTVIFSTHRLSTLAFSDETLLLDPENGVRSSLHSPEAIHDFFSTQMV